MTSDRDSPIGAATGPSDVERRLQTLEAEVAALKRNAGQPSVDPRWLTRLIGSMEDLPEFAEVVAEGRRIRESHDYIDEVPDAW